MAPNLPLNLSISACDIYAHMNSMNARRFWPRTGVTLGASHEVRPDTETTIGGNGGYARRETWAITDVPEPYRRLRTSSKGFCATPSFCAALRCIQRDGAAVSTYAAICSAKASGGRGHQLRVRRAYGEGDVSEFEGEKRGVAGFTRVGSK